MRNRLGCGSTKVCLVARIGVGSGLSRSLCIVVVELVGIVVVGLGCSWLVGRCSSVDGRLELGRGLVVGSCSFGLGQLGVGLEQLSGHHLGILGCSIFRRMIHHRTGLTCHMGRRSSFELELVDIVVEQLVGLAVVVLVGRLANGLRWLGIWRKIG
jgi:hypothetical protein